MSAHESRPSQPEPEITALDEVRCPDCGSEDGIECIEHPQCPPEQRGRCSACGHRADPLAFHHTWNWERMSEEEREQARTARDRAESALAEYHHSATYLAEQREP